MRIGKIYRNFIHNNLFIKVIFIFAIIVNLTIITMSYWLYSFMSASIVQNELGDQREAMDRVNRYLEQNYEWTQGIVQEIYADNLLSASVSHLLRSSYQQYIQYTLGDNGNGPAPPTNALEYFGEKAGADVDVRNLILYSSEKQFMYVYQGSTAPKLISTNAAHSYIPDVMAAEGPSASVPNVWVRKAIGQWDTRLYSMRTQINDKNTLKNIGQLVVYFDSEMIRQSLSQNADALRGTILVLTPAGQVIFDTSGRYYGQKYPYLDQINSLQETAVLDEPSYVSTLAQNAAGFTVVGISPKSELAEAYAGLRRLIILISAACIVVAVVIPSLVIVNIAKRTKKIVRHMKKVEGGDLRVRLQDHREDELGQISRSFNEMVEELNRTIEREYKAEIRLKQTELAALQARINPHFLYNTLEVIRMRAVSLGAEDVAEMIYSLAALFRNTVRSNAECRLAEELEICRLYLELFRIRYKDKFAYAIECDPSIASVKVPKMLLQPIVENYIVHGLEAERYDNRITISAAADEGFIRICVWNNGRVIGADELQRIRAWLHIPSSEEEGGFGLRSVHERLTLVYGPEYGITIESGPDEGTSIRLVIPIPIVA